MMAKEMLQESLSQVSRRLRLKTLPQMVALPMSGVMVPMGEGGVLKGLPMTHLGRIHVNGEPVLRAGASSISWGPLFGSGRLRRGRRRWRGGRPSPDAAHSTVRAAPNRLRSIPSNSSVQPHGL